MKYLKYQLSICLVFFINFIWACEACKAAQPKLTQNFTHGVGPRGNFDWVIVAAVAVIAVYTLVFSIKYLAKPGEKKSNHIKYSILQD